MSAKPGIYPPITAGGTAERIPLEVPWLSNPVVAAGELTGTTAVVTDALVEGIYYVWVDGPAWANAGEDGGSVDPATAGPGAAKPHDGGYWPVGIREGERIALRRRPMADDDGDAVTLFRIFKGA